MTKGQSHYLFVAVVFMTAFTAGCAAADAPAARPASANSEPEAARRNPVETALMGGMKQWAHDRGIDLYDPDRGISRDQPIPKQHRYHVEQALPTI
jgi:hypothetical protein